MQPDPNNPSVTYVVGRPLEDTSPQEMFSGSATAFLDDFASRVLKSKTARAYPDLMAAGFWFRKGHLTQIRQRFGAYDSRLGKGLAFHIAPGNVPLNFLYSFAFGLLSGCCNIVRIPTKHSDSLEAALGILSDLFAAPEHSSIARKNAFVRYERSDQATAMFSAVCDARIIWGGDTTIGAIRQTPIPARATELTFADRYSLAVIDEDAVEAADDGTLQDLARNFYSDAFLMDQNACSSPHLVVWLGAGNPHPKERFWAFVSDIVRHEYALADVQSVDRHMRMLSNFLISEGQRLSTDLIGQPLVRVSLPSVTTSQDSLRGIHGLFYEANMETLEPLAQVVNNRYQTLTYFGVEKATLLDFVLAHRLAGIDRIVPIGNALSIDTIWDGTDTMHALSRIVDVK